MHGGAETDSCPSLAGSSAQRMDRPLALGRIRGADHAGVESPRPSAERRPRCGAAAGLLRIGATPLLLLLSGLTLGCDDGDALDPTSGADRGTARGEDPTDAARRALPLSEALIAEHAPLSPNAKPELHARALAERAHAVAPGDGGGRVHRVEAAAIDPPSGAPPRSGAPGRAERPAVEAGTRHRFRLDFEVGPDGIAIGGALSFVPDPFWSWSPAQTAHPEAPGYTTARLLGSGEPSAALVADTPDAHFRVEGRALAAGERIELVYGAGPAGARADRYAERGAPLWIAVDADGDGFRRFLERPGRVDVVAGPARRLVAHGPADTPPGEAFEITLALVDAVGNRAVWPDAAARESANDGSGFVVVPVADSDLPPAGAAAALPRADPATDARRLRVAPAPGEGVLRWRVEGRGRLADFSAELPPILVRRSGLRLVWADLHGHSGGSDGTGTPDDYFAYARDVARLDVAALTDHDHWGPLPLDGDPARAHAIFAATDAAHAPGRFVTLPGYEWTSWLHGHRHVLWFDPPGGARTLHSSIDPASDRPDELWAALRGQPALTIAHHPAGEPIATSWRFRPDPALEPVVEIASVHGQSESLAAPLGVRGARPGHTALDALRSGLRLGFVGSGDSHDGHPGLAWLASGQSGLAGLFTPALEREAIRDTLRRRRTFATTGHRPFLEVDLDGIPMGGERPATATGTSRLRVRYEGVAPIERVELIRSGGVATLDLEPGHGRRLALDRTIPALRPGEFHYVRIEEVGGGLAWSSPIFATAADSPD